MQGTNIQRDKGDSIHSVTVEACAVCSLKCTQPVPGTFVFFLATDKFKVICFGDLFADMIELKK